MPSKRFAFASSLWSFLPGIVVILLFAFTDLDLYRTESEATESYQSLLFFAPVILILFIIYHSLIGFIQNSVKRPTFLITILSSIIAALPFPLLVAFSKHSATQDERLVLVLTALIIFGLLWLSLFTGSCYQYFKIKGRNLHGT
ncbi:hypothetical protein QTP81_13690 [Alteromonas sp. ASW11-36]|uniref:Uncharacterized protein n=1 Tax=Alteromonas arenosi TaxID=3055817 RepID=A0ABT7SZP0_9ALTE|nr:hypothetical protein [Alteromonas sp. ASW11-36]MDM7861648.1 hypothetical protein [Alteromonas sp. ASW11-36]